MKKTTCTLLVLVLLASCNNEKLKEESSNSAVHSITLPLRTIKENSVERQSYFSLDSVDLSKLAAIDSAFYSRYFLNLPVSNLKNYKMEFDPYSRYYFFDYKDAGELALFSIIHNDEVGYSNLYHFTYDKKDNQLLQVDYLAATGSDGGHKNKDQLKFNQFGDLLFQTSLSEEWSDFSKGSSIQYDSVIYKILFSSNGTKYTKLDSLSRVDTVWITN